MEPNSNIAQEIKQTIDQMGRQYNELTQTHQTLQTELKTIKTEDTLLKEKIDKIANDYSKGHETIQELKATQKALEEQIDKMQTKMNRPSFAVDADTEAKAREGFREFTRIALTRKGAFNVNTDLDAVATDTAYEEYKQYTKATSRYYRRGAEPGSGLSADEIKALSVGSDVDGGFLVRPEYSNRMITRIFETSPLRGMATVETISGSEIKFPVDISEAGCGWVGEQQARTETTSPQVNEKAIMAHEMYALVKATQTILDDAGIDVETWVSNKASDKMARVEATAFISGNGVNKPRGILTYPAGTNWNQIEQVATGTSGSFTVAGLTKTVGQLKEPYHAGSTWLMRRESMPLIMLLQDGAGRYIFQPIFSEGYDKSPLLGYPIRFAYDMPTAGANALAAAFGNFKAAYTIVDRQGIVVLRDPFSYKPFVGFYFRKRVGGDVMDFDAYKLVKLT